MKDLPQWVRFVTGATSPTAQFSVFERPTRICVGFGWVRLASFRRGLRGLRGTSVSDRH
jgi:hypothetical protein